MITPDQLRQVAVLADLSEAELNWLIEHGRVMEYPVGQIVIRHGDVPEWMYILLEGELEFYWANSSHAIYITRGGELVGALPYSRMQRYNGSGRATVAIRTLAIHKDDFRAMLEAIPALGPKLVGIMLDRVREITRLGLREEKLMSLGKLAAGLAHELNNPASAAHRAATLLGQALAGLETHTLELAGRLEPAQLRQLRGQVEALQPSRLGPLERDDLEQSLADWLEAKGVGQAWNHGPTLADAGITPGWLEALQLPDPVVPAALGWLEAHLRTHRLAQDIAVGTGRVSGLVAAVKRHTHMDQSPMQEVDIRQGLEDTLALFGHRLEGLTLERTYDPQLPRVLAFGGELNQVWHNLIENALEALCGAGTLWVRTAREQETVLVEIGDSGPGVPAAICEQIFDPFFTTKAVGQGTGLGLDTVRRIVQRHHGSIRLESQPGSTRFQVRLPFAPPAGKS